MEPFCCPFRNADVSVDSLVGLLDLSVASGSVNVVGQGAEPTVDGAPGTAAVGDVPGAGGAGAGQGVPPSGDAWIKF